jgi:hypothetical protein
VLDTYRAAVQKGDGETLCEMSSGLAKVDFGQVGTLLSNFVDRLHFAGINIR